VIGHHNQKSHRAGGFSGLYKIFSLPASNPLPDESVESSIVFAYRAADAGKKYPESSPRFSTVKKFNWRVLPFIGCLCVKLRMA
jgi:hypothetical protein